MHRCTFVTAALLSLTLAAPAQTATQANWPTRDGTYTIRNFHFKDGETIPELRLHRLGIVTKTEEQYVVFRKGEEHIIERNLRRKHSGLLWKQLPGDEAKSTIEVRAEFDAQAVCSTGMNRTVATGFQ
jgi:hypothetical protein